MSGAIQGHFGVMTPQQQAQMEMQIVMAAIHRAAMKLAQRQHELFIRCLRAHKIPTMPA